MSQIDVAGTIYENISGYFIVSEDVVTTISNQLAKDHLLPYPNPFANEVTIPLVRNNLSNSVELYLYNRAGVEVFSISVILDRPLNSIITWKPENLSSGIYYYQIQNKGFVQRGKLIYNR